MSEGLNNKYFTYTSINRIEPIKPMNDEFTLCKVYIQGVGKNRNYSYMSKDNILRAEPTLHYIPVVGHLMVKYDADGNEVGRFFGGHDYTIDENWELKALTVPFGVVTEDPVSFEEIEEYGQTVEYMTANVYLWTGRYPEMMEAIYSDDCWFAQSMEINVSQSRPLEEDSNYVELLDWQYSALCILGKSDDPKYNTEPCFISSKFVPISYSEHKEQFNTEMCEMRERLAFILSPKEGGEMPMDQEKIITIFKEFDLAPGDVDFSIDGLDEDGIRAAISEYVAASQQEDPSTAQEADVTTAVQDVPEAECDFVCEFVATYNQRRDALRNALQSEYERDPRGEVISATHYWVADFDDNYVFVERYTYHRDGDDSQDYGRFSYQFNSDDISATINGSFEEMYLMWLTKEEKQKLDASRDAFAELVAYKENAEKEKRNAAVNSIFEKFSSLRDLDEYKKIQEESADTDVDVIEMKLFALRGRIEMEKEASANGEDTDLVHVHNVRDEEVEELYGGLLKRKK